MATLTIEISDDTKRYLERIASEEGESLESVIERILAKRTYADHLREMREKNRGKSESAGFNSEQDILDGIS